MYLDIAPNEDRWYNLEDLPNEVWKDIKDFEGLYQVSNYGRVKRLERVVKSFILNHSTNTLHEKICKPTKVHNKYYKNVLTKNNKKYNKQVHRLVAESFIPNPDDKPMVNHKEPVTSEVCDNRVCNLEWCTCSYNTQYMIKLGRNKNGSKNRTYATYGKHHGARRVYKIDKYGKTVQIYDSVRRFIEDSENSKSKCYKILNSNSTHNGYLYSYEERGD